MSHDDRLEADATTPPTQSQPQARPTSRLAALAPQKKLGHRLNNLLAGIVANAELLLLSESNEARRRQAECILGQAAEASEIVRREMLLPRESC